MASRLATDSEVAQWHEQGWVLLEGLVATEEIDAAADDLRQTFPATEEYHRDPQGVTEKWKGRPPPPRSDFVWPDEGPGFRPEQQRWSNVFPFTGTGTLNRLCVHRSIVDFAERVLGTVDIRLYQAHATAKYAGLTNYEQPMHIDINHSWLPAMNDAPWRNLEGFLYLSDVHDSDNPTRLVALADSAHVGWRHPVVLPDKNPAIYAAERAAPGVRGSYLAYSSDVFHRGSAFGSSGTARYTLSLAFKRAGQDWIGYDTQQSRANGIDWTRFVEKSTPRELELFGFPPPGHPVWTSALLDQLSFRYPALDVRPWRTRLPTA